MRIAETVWDGEDCYIIEMQDITKRKRDEEALRHSRDRLRLLHEVAHQLATCTTEEEIYRLTVDAQGEFLTLNPAVSASRRWKRSSPSCLTTKINASNLHCHLTLSGYSTQIPAFLRRSPLILTPLPRKTFSSWNCSSATLQRALGASNCRGHWSIRLFTIPLLACTTVIT